jgi:tetratricopeptide (TPR) repeat protein
MDSSMASSKKKSTGNRSPIESPLQMPRAGSAQPPPWAAAVLLAITIGAVYAPARRVPFIFDDAPAILGNPSITSLWPLIGPVEKPGPLNPPADFPISGRPLVNLSLAVNYFLGGFDTIGYHVFNVIVHFLSSILLWTIVRRTLLLPYFAGRFASSARWLALAVSLLWALHPIQTEAVIYVTQRTELMVTFFYLATLYCSLRYWTVTAHRPAWLSLAVLACLCGMASKEVMVSAPLIVLLFERTFVTGSLKTAVRNSWPLYAGLASTWLLLLVLSLGSPHGASAGFGLGISPIEWWLTQSQIFWMYMTLIVWPAPLLFHYQLPYLVTFGQSWMYVVPLLLVGIVTLVLLWRNHPVGLLGTLIFAILSPTMVVPIGFEMAAERRVYLPLAALTTMFVVGGYLAAEAVRKRWSSKHSSSDSRRLMFRSTAALVCLLSIVLAFVSARRLSDYGNEMNLWRQVLQHQPENYLAHNNLGRMLIESGRISEALDHLQLSVTLNPSYYPAYNNLSVALIRAGRHAEGAQSAKRAVTGLPDYAEAYQNLGNALMRMDRFPEAIEQLEHALRLKPYDAEAHNNMAVALSQIGQSSRAIEHLRQSIQLNPKDAKPRVNLGKLLNLSGDENGAVAQFTQAIQLQPNRADLHSYIGAILGKQGRTNDAIPYFQAALRLDPNFVDAYGNLALALAVVGRSDEAIATSQQGIKIARSMGQQEAAQKAEEWLTHYRALLRRRQGAAPASSPSTPLN